MELSYLHEGLQGLVKPSSRKGKHERAADRALPGLLLRLRRPEDQPSVISQRSLKEGWLTAHSGRPTTPPLELVEERPVAAP
jgi:hypothetical protein